MSQNTQALEPCPFCGGNAAFNEHDDECYFTALHNAKTAPRGDVSGMMELIPAWNRRAALSATQPAQAAQGEPAEHWHRLYLDKCQQYNDRVAQLGGVIEGLEAEAAQGAGEVVAELKRLASVCPELNLNNYGPDDVDELNAWAIEVAQAIDQLSDTQPAASADATPAQAAADARDAELPPDGADRGAEAERAAMYGTFGG